MKGDAIHAEFSYLRIVNITIAMEKLKHIEMFKPHYEEQECEELFEWFEQRMDRLPEKLQILDCLSTDNLGKTVAAYLHLLKSGRRNVATSGYMAQLFTIREALKRDYPEFA